jgi:hypothetical protein
VHAPITVDFINVRRIVRSFDIDTGRDATGSGRTLCLHVATLLPQGSAEEFRTLQTRSCGQRTEEGVPADSWSIDNASAIPKEPAMTNPTARMIFAAAAAATTLTLFSAIVSIAEPQRSVLIAKAQRSEKMLNAPVAVTVASGELARLGK